MRHRRNHITRVTVTPLRHTNPPLHSRGRTFRWVRVFFWLAVTGCAALAFGIETHRFDLNIRSTNVSEELKNLYEATGVHIIYYDEWRMPARGLQGSYTIEEALVRILGNTGLVCEYMEDGSIIIRASLSERALGRCLRPQKHPPSDAQGPTPMPQGEMAEVDVLAQLGTHILGLEQVGSPLVSWDQVQIRS